MNLASESESYEVGILTALEHEYQSVVRRLDEVTACTDDDSYGMAILDRQNSSSDLKDDALERRRLVGWCRGRIGKQRVLIVCSGRVGREGTQAAVEEVELLYGVPSWGWLVVGVCGTTAPDLPIGAILVSQPIIDVVRTASRRFAITSCIEAIDIAIPDSGTYALKDLFRRPLVVRPVTVVDPAVVPVIRMPFVCPPQLINETSDRSALREFLITKKVIGKNQHLGIEMEGSGVPTAINPSSAVIKAVCDYADDRKKSWSSELKVALQLFAAETAADFAVSVVSALPGLTTLRNVEGDSVGARNEAADRNAPRHVSRARRHPSVAGPSRKAVRRKGRR